MKALQLSVVCLLLATSARAQIEIPVTDVALAYPSIPAVTVKLGATSRAILPTPFVLGGQPYNQSALWFCMDPLQTIFYKGSGQPAGAELNYVDHDTDHYDKWTPLAPGLSAARLQLLADLFTANLPRRDNSLLGGALQLAVPEITNEFDGELLSLTTGKFRASGGTLAAKSVVDLAQSMLDALDDPGVQGHGDVRSLRFLIDGTYTNRSGTVPVQDLVGFVPVPEPSTYAAIGAALLLTVVASRAVRRRRTSTPLS